MAPLVWFVTGCSSGFGRAFVDQIITRGDRVIATARRSESLTELEKTGAAVLQLDVSEDQSNIEKIMTGAIEIYGHIDVLVNNAAYVLGGAWEDLRKSGTTVFISSMAAWRGGEFGAAYSGTKFALEGMVESLWRETASLGLRTVLIEPGFFRTNLLSNTNLQSSLSSIPDYIEGSKAHNDWLRVKNQNQIGDPDKAVSIIMDVVKGQGIGENKPLPFRLALGKDAYDVIKEKCEDVLGNLDEWREITCSTDLDN